MIQLENHYFAIFKLGIWAKIINGSKTSGWKFDEGYLHSLNVFFTLLVNYKGKNSNFVVKELGGHSYQMIKAGITSNGSI